MITELRCEGFKGLDGHRFRFRPLTVLTGTNCSGKSSIIQAILLASMAQRSQDITIPLNDGPFELRLGTVGDVVSVGGMGSGIRVILRGSNDEETLWEFDASDHEARYLKLSKAIPDAAGLGLEAGRAGRFTYLSLMREGQADLMPMHSSHPERMEIGCRGQYVADLLRIFQNHGVETALRHPKAGVLPLLKQVEAWLSEFVPQVELRVVFAPELDAVGLRYRQGDRNGDWVRPANTGFGLSYCLPIVVAGLLTRPGSLLIVDSPEAHLHPSAQSAMGQFLTRLAAHGIQTVIETHSDHILNGIRVASLLPEHPFQKEEAMIHFLHRENEGLQHQEIEITSSGKLSSYPKCFFDQSEIDLRRILDLRRREQ